MAHGMITGYFHHSFDQGHNFEQFAKSYGKQYGAYIMARDEPMDFEITDKFWEPSDYHLKAIEAAEAIIKAHDSGNPDELRALFNKVQQAEIARVTKDIGEIEAQIARAKEWQECANRMTPATPDHQGLVTAMRTQIKDTITECQSSLDYATNRLTEANTMTVQSWSEARYAEAVKDIEYHRKAYKEDAERQLSRKAWHEAYMKMIADAQQTA